MAHVLAPQSVTVETALTLTLYRQGSRRLRPWEEDTTVTGARTNNSTVWLLGVLASMPAYTVSEDGMAPQNRLDVAWY